ncbi:protein stum homolog [Anneissia japonica]|uniref:protein stum homolog n=1 Tax=Anneissia japonica TaxID=1529436 RepID=UPI00142593E5|nr:protein stum homolog [Anneissia japonica]
MASADSGVCEEVVVIQVSDAGSPSKKKYPRSLSRSDQPVVINVRTKQSAFRLAVPCMPMPLAIVCCLLNIVGPGLGTFISAFTVFCCGYTETTPYKAFLWNVLAAFFQIITFPVVVGWIWSILWGMTFVTLSADYAHEKELHNKRSEMKENLK